MLVAATSPAYELGQVIGMALVALIAVAVVRRALTSGFGSPASAPASASPDAAFVALPAGSSSRRPSGRDKAIALLAVVAAGAIIAAGLSSLLPDRPSGPWSTAAGASLKAGFMNGCRSSGPDKYCGCLFDGIASLPAYDTPREFATLQYAIQRAQAGDPTAIPQPVVNAVRACKG
jgi:hypothetical protein